MTILAYPCKAPIIIREDRLEQFQEKCKKAAITPEQKRLFLEYSRNIKKH